jgi:hypothetical protein
MLKKLKRKELNKKRLNKKQMLLQQGINVKEKRKKNREFNKNKLKSLTTNALRARRAT